MENIERNKIKDVMLELENVSKKYNYTDFELALVLYLRTDISNFDNISNDSLIKIADDIRYSDSLMSTDLRYDVDKYISEV